MTIAGDIVDENDLYYCEDCVNWLPKELRRSINRCKRYEIMSVNIMCFNRLRVCEKFEIKEVGNEEAPPTGHA